MGIRAIPIPIQVVSYSLSFPFPILSSVPIPMGFPWDSHSHWESPSHGHLYCVVDKVQTAMDEVVNVHAAATKQDKQSTIEQDYEELNVDQKRIVNRVVNAVSENEKPIRLIVSGQGGTGKSRVIDVIRRIISAKAPADDILSVVVAAPTGLAAFNVRGSTIHRILCLPNEHGKPADYRPLS